MESGREMKGKDIREMRVTFGGVRGSAPANGCRFARYGCATTSVLFQDTRSGDALVIDAGTGLGNLWEPLEAARATGRLLMLFTHFHLDHLQGLPTFPPLFSGAIELTLASPALENRISVKQAATRLISPPFWPILPFSETHFHTLPPVPTEPRGWGPFDIRWMPVAHPNGCTAYRIDHRPSGTATVFATDMEWPAMTADARSRFAALCLESHPADVLIMDGQYDDSDRTAHTGWGHSTWQTCASLANDIGILRLFITHHAPEADDALLDARQEALQAILPSARLAKEGESFFAAPLP